MLRQAARTKLMREALRKDLITIEKSLIKAA